MLTTGKMVNIGYDIVKFQSCIAYVRNCSHCWQNKIR